jgi:hypothetical protein
MLHTAAAGSVASLVGLIAWRCFTPTPQRLSAIIIMAMRESPIYEADYDVWWQLVLLMCPMPLAWLLWQASERAKTAGARRSGLCPACGYDLRATPERCPECGMIPGQ